MNKKAEDEEKRNDRAGINRKEAIWKGKRQRRRRHRRNKGVDVFGCGVKKKMQNRRPRESNLLESFEPHSLGSQIDGK